MKKIFTLAIIISSLTFFTHVSNAQPCGIDATINIYGGVTTVSYTADTSSLQPGWNIYSYEWEVNNNIFSTQWAFADWLPQGYNHVCLRVSATNTSTGDSCTSEHCNVFYSTGDAPFPYFDVFNNGLDVNFTGYYYGGPVLGTPSTIMYDFGDGMQSSSNSLSETHTYASSGDYNVCLYITFNVITGGTAVGQICRKIHVDNGLPNLELNTFFDNTVCDSVSLTVSSSPPFTSAMVLTNLPASLPTLIDGMPGAVTYIDIPGHDFLGVEAIDNSGTGAGDYGNHLVFLNDCGIIPDTIYGTVFNDLNYNGLHEAGEPGIPNRTISAIGSVLYTASEFAEYSAITDSAGNYSIIVPHTQMDVRLINTGGYTLTYPNVINYLVDFNTGTGHYNYNWGLSALTTEICGTVYLDDNQDSLFTTTSDRRFPNVHVKVFNTITQLEYHVFTNQNGVYCIDLPPGNFVVTPVYYRLDSAEFYPDSIIVNSPSGGNFNNNNFGFTSPVPGNFVIELRDHFEARPGFDYSMVASLINRGYNDMRGTVVLNYDPALTYLSHQPANGVVNTSGHTITWITDSLRPGVLAGYIGNFNVPVTTPLGTLLTSTTSVTALPGFTEYELTNNFDTIQKTVIGSFDPNDKSVTPEGVGANGDVLHGTRLNYRIRFQNTGTASAINIIVTDTLDTDLDMNTLMMEGSSHPYILVTNGRILVWKFFNINLPDSNTNEPLSHGYIEFSISPYQPLPDGTPVTNSANIYFDFNPPVITNTTVNTFQTTIVSIGELPSEQQLFVYPVPVDDIINIKPEINSAGPIVLELYDIAGKKITTLYEGNFIPGQVISKDLSELNAGVYLLQLMHSGNVSVTKILIE